MKKLITNFIRVATSGSTVDGREISAEHIQQMAANYSPEKYGARIWLEHLRSIIPDGFFDALGDVEELKAEKVEDGKYALFARLSPTDKLIQFNKNRQKVFTSIELEPNFSDSGEAYLTGLAVTDSPASIGTEMLQFSQKNKEKFSGHDAITTSLYSQPLQIDDNALEDFQEEKPSLVELVKELLSKNNKQQDSNNEDFEKSIVLLTENQQELSDKLRESEESLASYTSKFKDLEEKFSSHIKKYNELIENLSTTTEPGHNPRPDAGGNNQIIEAEC